MKFQDKFYDVIDHNKYPSSEKSAEKCILMNSYFHHSEPNHGEGPNFGHTMLNMIISAVSHGLLCDCETSVLPSFQALVCAPPRRGESLVPLSLGLRTTNIPAIKHRGSIKIVLD